MEKDILIKALETIAQYDINSTYGICPYGCDTPFIAQEALQRYKKEELLKHKEAIMPTKLICNVTRCGWKGTVDDVLKAPSPFDAEELWACPRCKTINSLHLACDEHDCWKAVECGTPTPEGYRSTCSEHAPKGGNYER